jgi:hypothetical protein
MDADTLTLVTAGFLSLLFSFVPGLRDWFGKKGEEFKQLFMLGLMALLAAAIFGLSYANVMQDLWPAYAVECTAASFWLLVRYFLLAIIANVGVFKATKYLRKTPEIV